jgi:hypothetical protein
MQSYENYHHIIIYYEINTNLIYITVLPIIAWDTLNSEAMGL